MKIGDTGSESIDVDDNGLITIGLDELPQGARGEKMLISFLTTTSTDITAQGDAYLKFLINLHYPGTLK